MSKLGVLEEGRKDLWVDDSIPLVALIVENVVEKSHVVSIDFKIFDGI
jgi:hypothetical protein